MDPAPRPARIVSFQTPRRQLLSSLFIRASSTAGGPTPAAAPRDARCTVRPCAAHPADSLHRFQARGTGRQARPRTGTGARLRRLLLRAPGATPARRRGGWSVQDVADPELLGALRADLAGFTVDGLEEAWGPVAAAALGRDDPVPALLELDRREPTRVRLLGGCSCSAAPSRRATRPIAFPRLGLDGALALGLVEVDGATRPCDRRPAAVRDRGRARRRLLVDRLGPRRARPRRRAARRARARGGRGVLDARGHHRAGRRRQRARPRDRQRHPGPARAPHRVAGRRHGRLAARASASPR